MQTVKYALWTSISKLLLSTKRQKWKGFLWECVYKWASCHSLTPLRAYYNEHFWCILAPSKAPVIQAKSRHSPNPYRFFIIYPFIIIYFDNSRDLRPLRAPDLSSVFFLIPLIIKHLSILEFNPTIMAKF